MLRYASGRIACELGDGRTVAVEVETADPAEGLVTIRVVDAPAGAMALRLRPRHHARVPAHSTE
ncbi:hypothetical protein [Streptomyces sp. 184]|uniref:hypothetical protein n=1 Tax=Streptomyces sp. 184 TaxID=1827526 RepID=UPI003891BCCA